MVAKVSISSKSMVTFHRVSQQDGRAHIGCVLPRENNYGLYGTQSMPF